MANNTDLVDAIDEAIECIEDNTYHNGAEFRTYEMDEQQRELVRVSLIRARDALRWKVAGDNFFDAEITKRARRWTVESQNGFLLAQGIGMRSLMVDWMEAQGMAIYDGTPVTIRLYEKKNKQWHEFHRVTVSPALCLVFPTPEEK